SLPLQPRGLDRAVASAIHPAIFRQIGLGNLQRPVWRSERCERKERLAIRQIGIDKGNELLRIEIGIVKIRAIATGLARLAWLHVLSVECIVSRIGGFVTEMI